VAPAEPFFGKIFMFWGRTMVLGQNLLFDPRPKTRRADLFGRDRELEMLAENDN
jgi:hypothetical protein